MAGRLSLELESSLDALEEITEAVEAFGAEQDWSAELLFHVQLVLDELAQTSAHRRVETGACVGRNCLLDIELASIPA